MSAPLEARKTAAAAISPGSANRPEGISALIASPLGPAQAFLPNSVRTTVGDRVFTVMPCLPHSRAKVLDIPITANLDAQYATCPSMATEPAWLARLMILPPPA